MRGAALATVAAAATLAGVLELASITAEPHPFDLGSRAVALGITGFG